MKKISISIIGTRGIPNNYGGFEQFAEYLAKGLVNKGHKVAVYNSHTHPFQGSNWEGVEIIHKYDPESKIGTAGQFIYDLSCIRDLKNHDIDIILQLGYTSNSIWNKLLPSQPKIITNMDGLEWKRSKYNKPTQFFLKYAEKLAAQTSDFLVADSVGVQNHLMNLYGLNSTFIPYGATLFSTPDASVIAEFNLKEYTYNILIARMEPENNIETIIKGHIESEFSYKLIVVGTVNNRFSKYLISKYSSDKIRFLGGIYDQNKLNNLRYFSNIYFHGHSVGGTNPSLLEAMASNSLICAHNNIFNNSILHEDAFYFNDSNDISNLLDSKIKKKNYNQFLEKNINKITNSYSWGNIINQYENLFSRILEDKNIC